jgi:hypothetical protein
MLPLLRDAEVAAAATLTKSLTNNLSIRGS